MRPCGIADLSYHCFRLVVCVVPSHYLSQWWIIINCTLRNKFQWNFDQNTMIFIQENAFENILYKMAAILSRPQCVNQTIPIMATHLSWAKWLKHLTENCNVVYYLPVFPNLNPLGISVIFASKRIHAKQAKNTCAKGPPSNEWGWIF